MPLQVAITTLGENNVGPFGPTAADPELTARIAIANANPERRITATRRYICVDGRLSQEEIDTAALEKSEADPQMPGGQAVTESAAYYMTDGSTAKLSETAASVTRAAIEDGFVVTVHGANGDKSKCVANSDIQEVLQENAKNVAIVVPIAYAVVSGLNMQSHITNEQLTDMVQAGQASANNDTLWDVDAAGFVDICVENGAQYIDLVGEHLEGGIRADLGEGAVDRAKLIPDIDRTEIIEQFIASLGQYKKDTFERYANKGLSETEAAKLVAKAVLYTIGISKHLSTKDMPVFLVG